MSGDRRAVIAAMVPAGRRVIDVGADHGHLAHAIGAIATERLPHRAGRSDVRWVIADGLAPFREVDVAVIAGMGADTIARILARGPRPALAVLHAQDAPPRLRSWLARNGWRIDAEALAPEARRFAEVVRVVPGTESATGLVLHYGPRLLDGGPWVVEHLTQRRAEWQGIAQATVHVPNRHKEALEHINFLDQRLLAL